MKRIIIGLITVLMVSAGLNAAVITSVASGSFAAPGTWDGGVVPTAADDVIIVHDVTSSANQQVASLTILSGGKCTVNGGSFNCQGDLDIQAAGEMSNSKNLVILGDYTLNGVHSGNGYIYHFGAEISGTGIMSNNKEFQFRSEDKTVLPGTVLDFTSLRGAFKNNVALTNQGTIKFRLMSGAGYNKIINDDGANLIFTRLFPGFPLDASIPGNTVTYSAPSSFAQLIYPSISGYYNLVLNGMGAPGFKRLTSDITVLNDLRIKNANLDVHKDGAHHNIYLHGDWVNENGTFFARKGTVHMLGTGSISHFANNETFHNLDLRGTTTLNTDITVTGLIDLVNSFDAMGFTTFVEGDWNKATGGNFMASNGVVNFSGATNSLVNGSTNFDNVTLDKTSGATTTINPGGRIYVWETLLLDNGVLNTNDGLVIRSDESRTGRIGIVQNGTLNGDTHIERYLNDAINGWHLLAAPIDGMTLNEWKYDFITTGFTGANYPAYPFVNITKYDETEAGHKDIGILDVTNITESVPNGEGRRAYIAAGHNMIKVKGDIISGDMDYNLTYTSTSGGAIYDGWNLVANPYASTIDWDEATGWDKSNLDDAIYVWDPVIEQYMSYIGGVGTNGGSSLIPSSQAFWVQATAASPTLRIKENAKKNTAVDFKSNISEKDYFYLTVETANGRKDQAALALNEAASYHYDPDFDAYEFASPNETVPSLAIMSADDVECSIYSVPGFDGTYEVPLKVYVGETGLARFTAERMKSFPGGYNFGIYDLETDETHAITDDNSVQFTLDEGTHEGRFFLVVTSSDQTKIAGTHWLENDLVVKLTASNSRDDIVIARYDRVATLDFDESLDILKDDVEAGSPSIAMLSNDELPLGLYVLGDIPGITEIPLTVKVPTTGATKFTIENRKDFPLLVELSIYDMLDHKEYPLSRNQSVELLLDEGEYYDRFYLIMSVVARGLDNTASEADLQIACYAENGRSDNVVVRHDLDATWDFDEFLDIMEDEPESASSPTLAVTTNDGIHVSDMSIPDVRQIHEIPMVVRVMSSGVHTFVLENRKQFPFPVSLSIYDMETHIYHPFSLDDRVQFLLDDGDYYERFYLVIKPIMKSSELEDVMNIAIANDELVIVNGSTEGKDVDIRVYNGLGQVIDQSTNQFLESEIRMPLHSVQGVILVEVYEKKTGKKTVKKLLK